MKMKQTYILPLSGVIFLISFTLLCCVVKIMPDYLINFDNYFTDIVRDNLYPDLNLFFIILTKTGNLQFVLIITVILLIVFFIYKKIKCAIWLLSGEIIVSGILVPLLKIFTGRQRPVFPHLIIAGGLSFPSGHAAVSIVLYGTLIILTGIYIKNIILKYIFQILLILLIAGIGISRIYCGVHFPTDIIGGFLLGGTWLSMTYRIFDKGHA